MHCALCVGGHDQTTMMGTPSTAIVVEELLRLGARRLVRLGTCGGLAYGLHTGEYVIASAAFPDDGTTQGYMRAAGVASFVPTASFPMVRPCHGQGGEGGGGLALACLCALWVCCRRCLVALGVLWLVALSPLPVAPACCRCFCPRTQVCWSAQIANGNKSML